VFEREVPLVGIVGIIEGIMSSRSPGRLMAVFFLALLCACGSSVRTGVADQAEPPQCQAACPSFENKLETEHFILRWTNASSHQADNLSDPEIASQTAGYLETSWDKLTGLFGRTPYVPPGRSKIEVIFHDLECYAYADPPDGPIELNSLVWTSMPSIRQSTSAHELFHKLQYAYGYKTRWPPGESMLWFTEGTAAWAEVFVWGRVTRNCKIEGMFHDTNIRLCEAEDMALPFWIYFVSGNVGTPNDRLMVEFFEKYEKNEGNVNDALFDVIRDAYGPVDRFFRRFAHERKKGFWGQPASRPGNYTRILGPDGKDLVTEIKRYQEKKHQLPVCSAKGPGQDLED
jgi:hypothetical protein